jgi:hypothetical protein
MRLQKISLLSFALICLSCFAITATAAETRTWTSADGAQTFEGTLIQYNDYTGMVTVDRGDRHLTFDQKLLSDADIAYLRTEGPKLTASGSSRSGGAGVDATIPDELPDPDGEEADMDEPVQVFIIMGQSNTLEMGRVTDALKELYPYLADESGEWTVRKDVKNIHHQGSGGPGKGSIKRNDWLTISGNKIGIEIGIGHYLGHAIDAPVMILKSSIGNRSLGWDLLPPGVEAYEYDGTLQPGYGETKATAGDGPTKPEGEWYAGLQYDGDVARAKEVLDDLDKYYPGADDYEVAGFLWWQGDKDMRNPAHFNNYEKHLVALIKALRKEFDAPDAAFVTASLGQTKEDDTSSGHGVILQAMKNVASGKYSSELGDNIGFVYTHPLSKGSSSSAHYSGNAETYMNVGEAMGKTMVKMLGGQ